MDSPAPDGKMNAPPASAPVTSHTMPVTGEADFDQTIKIKTPGAGMMVFGRYKLTRVLGRGGMGVVWLADDIKLERPVALKFLPSLIGLDPAAVKELKTETRRGLELSHPNIVRIYDFVDDEEAAAISMEYVDGKTLSELRLGTEHGVFSAQEISKWLLGVCDALDYAHFQRKVVHRDLKPANIMFAEKGSVAKLADFGIARSLSDTMSRLSAAHTGSSGTLPYMSPQQAMGERPLPTDDVYSLGATIYELLTGKPPFYRGDLPTQIHGKVPPRMAERREELEVKAPDAIPDVWETVIAMCLHKDPAMRPANAGQLAELLGLKPASSTSRAYPRIPPPSAAKPEKKNLLPLALAGAGVVIAGAAYWMLSGGGEKTVPVVAAAAAANEPAASPAPEKEAAPPPVQPSPAETPPSEAATAAVTQPAEPAPAPDALPAAMPAAAQ
ncbi:MAG TPA: serine/threonine-protein kinase, partial [Prosthecobacter sp.]|nr:serine/threonine-protein kinase [Prosthecobacter sp.]